MTGFEPAPPHQQALTLPDCVISRLSIKKHKFCFLIKCSVLYNIKNELKLYKILIIRTIYLCMYVYMKKIVSIHTIFDVKDYVNQIMLTKKEN